MPSPDEIFRNLVSLVGRQIEVGLRGGNQRLTGTLVYAMVDSFLMEVGSTRRVIPFCEILYLDPVE